jgi:DNA polymerase I-like protein with 3'-5' exonuclease and polymerase domains
MIPLWTLDFETMPIGPRPEHYPPKPVGLAWRDAYGERGYETDWEKMREILYFAQDCQKRGCPVTFHNGKFDMHVAAKHFGIRFQDDEFHDTMLMAFLMDPYGRSGLKTLSEKWLGWAEEEKDACVEWILANKDRLPTIPWIVDKNDKPRKPSKNIAGAWLAWVPVEILGPYAIGDVERTWALAQTWLPLLERTGMMEAYDVERACLPIFMDNEEKGMRCDHGQLGQDIEMYQRAFAYAEEWLRWRLNAPGLNLDSDDDVASLLKSNQIVTQFAKTKTGKDSVSKKTLHPEQFSDQQVAQVLGYRNRLKTCLTMFMEPWYEQATARPDGRISTDWNQVQGDGGGTKTGRPSTRNPNFLNISKQFEGLPDGYEHPSFLGLPNLPLVRKYILPNEGEVILKRDFSGQELHIFGEFECGELREQFRKDPNLDVHNFVGGKITELTGNDFPRGKVKILNFQSIYGGGVPACANEMRVSHEEAREFKAFHDKALPGRAILANTLSSIVRRGQSIRTYGGRLYPRPPFIKRDGGNLSPADYRLINYLVQGSAADVTKRAMINLVSDPAYNSFFMLQVYDEMNISAPIAEAYEQMQVLKRAMESVPLSTGLPTDGEYGFTWGDMKELENEEDLKHVIPF